MSAPVYSFHEIKDCLPLDGECTWYSNLKYGTIFLILKKYFVSNEVWNRTFFQDFSTCLHKLSC
jgi:hypothetical protein